VDIWCTREIVVIPCPTTNMHEPVKSAEMIAIMVLTDTLEWRSRQTPIDSFCTVRMTATKAASAPMARPRNELSKPQVQLVSEPRRAVVGRVSEEGCGTSCSDVASWCF
jgi:hypothetical protein